MRCGVKRLFGHPVFLVILVLLGLTLSLPAWKAGFYLDDLVQQSKMERDHPLRRRALLPKAYEFKTAVMTLFDWFGPEQDRRAHIVNQNAVAEGLMPWWADPRCRQSFWRPLAAATHWLDHRLWPRRPLWMHAHSAMWFIAILVIARLLYAQTVHPAWCAGLAALLVALNQENWEAVSWIAARNSLIGVFFVALTLWLHDRHVRGRGWGWAPAAWTALGLGLLGNEGSVTAIGYLTAYTVCLDPRPWPRRLVGLTPYIVVVAGWRLAYRALGFGVGFTGLYIDPAAEPSRFLANAAEWAPLLLANIASLPLLGRYSALSPALRPWVWATSVVFLGALLIMFAPLLMRKREARFWGLGLLAALVPACAPAVPGDRVTLYAMLGFAPLAALFVQGVVDGEAWLPSRRSARRLLAVAGVLLLLCHVAAPLAGHARRFRWLMRDAPAASWVAPALRTDGTRQVVLLNPPDVMLIAYMPFLMVEEGIPQPERFRLLSSGLGALRLTRAAGDTLVLESLNGPLIPLKPRAVDLPPTAPWRSRLYRAQTISSSFRGEGVAFRPDETIHLPGLTVGVEDVDGRGMPTRARFTFAQDLDAPRYRWVVWCPASEAFRVVRMPAAGASVVLPGPFDRRELEGNGTS